MAYKHKELTDGIINAFYQVYNSLGYGFLEKVYENALAHEMKIYHLKNLRRSASSACYQLVCR